jgi:hypothetical protein
VANNRTDSKQAGADLGGAPEILTGRPTVAANNGTDLSNKALKAFVASDLSMAEWLRLPAPRSRCRLTQMSRTTLNEAIERGDVRAITVRQPGATRGIKLINRASLLAWLGKLDAEQNAAVKDGSAS